MQLNEGVFIKRIDTIGIHQATRSIPKRRRPLIFADRRTYAHALNFVYRIYLARASRNSIYELYAARELRKIPMAIREIVRTSHCRKQAERGKKRYLRQKRSARARVKSIPFNEESE